jgi:hypothetical protein
MLSAALLNSASAFNRAFRGLPRASGGASYTWKEQHMDAQMPAAPRRGGRWGPDVIRLYNV